MLRVKKVTRLADRAASDCESIECECEFEKDVEDHRARVTMPCSDAANDAMFEVALPCQARRVPVMACMMHARHPRTPPQLSTRRGRVCAMTYSGQPSWILLVSI